MSNTQYIRVIYIYVYECVMKPLIHTHEFLKHNHKKTIHSIEVSEDKKKITSQISYKRMINSYVHHKKKLFLCGLT